MASEARRAAARQNGMKSQGPKTAEGKSISRCNAITHGLTARVTMLPNEDPAAYEAQRAGWIERARPRDVVELSQVERLAYVSLQLERVARRSRPSFVFNSSRPRRQNELVNRARRLICRFGCFAQRGNSGGVVRTNQSLKRRPRAQREQERKQCTPPSWAVSSKSLVTAADFSFKSGKAWEPFWIRANRGRPPIASRPFACWECIRRASSMCRSSLRSCERARHSPVKEANLRARRGSSLLPRMRSEDFGSFWRSCQTHWAT